MKQRCYFGSGYQEGLSEEVTSSRDLREVTAWAKVIIWGMSGSWRGSSRSKGPMWGMLAGL